MSEKSTSKSSALLAGDSSQATTVEAEGELLRRAHWVIDHWFRHLQRESSGETIETGIVKDFRREVGQVGGGFFYLYNGPEILKAIEILLDNGWFVQPRMEEKPARATVTALELRKAKPGEKVSMANHQDWTRALAA